jgi:hypothetical protein
MSTTTFYSSLWDIDQLYLKDEVDGITLSQSSSPVTYTLVNYNLTYPPVGYAQFKIAGDSVWREFNDTNYSAFWVAVNMFLATTPTALNLVYYNYNGSNGDVNIRYWVWTDEVTH